MVDEVVSADFRPVVELADGDEVAMHCEMTGSHQGDFLGAAPTGQTVTLRGIDIVTVVDGKATEHWGFDDTWRLLAGGGPPPS